MNRETDLLLHMIPSGANVLVFVVARNSVVQAVAKHVTHLSTCHTSRCNSWILGHCPQVTQLRLHTLLSEEETTHSVAYSKTSE